MVGVPGEGGGGASPPLLSPTFPPRGVCMTRQGRHSSHHLSVSRGGESKRLGATWRLHDVRVRVGRSACVKPPTQPAPGYAGGGVRARTHGATVPLRCARRRTSPAPAPPAMLPHAKGPKPVGLLPVMRVQGALLLPTEGHSVARRGGAVARPCKKQNKKENIQRMGRACTDVPPLVRCGGCVVVAPAVDHTACGGGWARGGPP